MRASLSNAEYQAWIRIKNGKAGYSKKYPNLLEKVESILEELKSAREVQTQRHNAVLAKCDVSADKVISSVNAHSDSNTKKLLDAIASLQKKPRPVATPHVTPHRKWRKLAEQTEFTLPLGSSPPAFQHKQLRLLLLIARVRYEVEPGFKLENLRAFAQMFEEEEFNWAECLIDRDYWRKALGLPARTAVKFEGEWLFDSHQLECVAAVMAACTGHTSGVQ